MGTIWPAMVFNLCMGLLFAGFLLRAVRRFERRADAIIAQMDEADAVSQRKFNEARDEIRESMRAQVDAAVMCHMPNLIGGVPVDLGAVAQVVRAPMMGDTKELDRAADGNTPDLPDSEMVTWKDMTALRLKLLLLEKKLLDLEMALRATNALDSV